MRNCAVASIGFATAQPAELATPPVLIAFDVLYLKGRDLSQRPLRERRPRLEDLLDGVDLVHAVRRLAPNGLKAWEQVQERGYEGYVAKDEAGLYVGGRSSSRIGPTASTVGGGRRGRDRARGPRRTRGPRRGAQHCAQAHRIATGTHPPPPDDRLGNPLRSMRSLRGL